MKHLIRSFIIIILFSTITIAQLDLQSSGTYVSPSTQDAGSRLTVYYKIYNPNSYSVSVGLGCSIAPNGTENWIDDGSNDKVVSVPSGTSTQSRYFDIPSSATSGDYTVWYALRNSDFTGDFIDDLKKENLTVVNKPDLGGNNFDSQEPLAASQNFDVSFGVSNFGGTTNTTFYVDFYLSNNSSITKSDHYLGRYTFNGGMMGDYAEGNSISLTLPPAGSSAYSNGDGDYYIGMIIDPTDVISESDESNNSNEGTDIDRDKVTISSTSLPKNKLTINVKNIDGSYDPYPSSNGEVRLFKQNSTSWDSILTKTTNAQGQVSFTDLLSSLYYTDVYLKLPINPSELGDEEFWGQERGINLTSDKTITFTREMPYQSKLIVLDENGNDITGKTVSPFTKVTVRMFVTNPLDDPDWNSLPVFSELILDRDKKEQWDFKETKTTININTNNAGGSFDFSFTPELEGEYFSALAVHSKLYDKFLVTDRGAFGEIPLFKVETIKSNLTINIKNIDGTSIPYPSSNGKVILFTKRSGDWIEYTTATTDNNGSVTFSQIPNGDYYADIYHTLAISPSDFEEEFWGQKTDIVLDKDKTVEFVRDMPYQTKLTLYDEYYNEITGQTISPFTKIIVRMHIKNSYNEKLYVFPKVRLDRDKEADWDLAAEKLPVVIDANSEKYFDFDFIPELEGDYFSATAVLSKLYDDYLITDRSEFKETPFFTVKLNKSDLTLNITNVDGSSNPYPSNNGIVKLFWNRAGVWQEYTTKPTLNNGSVTFTQIPNGEYYADIYHSLQINPNTFGNDEFWGQERGIKLTANKQITFEREMPYNGGITVLDENGKDITGGSIAPNTPIKIRIKVVNPLSDETWQELETFSEIIIDKDKVEPWDLRLKSETKSIKINGEDYFEFSYTPQEFGDYYGGIGISSKLYEEFLVTDRGEFGSNILFSVKDIPKITLEKHLVSDQAGSINTANPGNSKSNFKAGENIRITLKAKNIGGQVNGLVVLNIFAPNGDLVYDSHALGKDNNADSPLLNNETDYYSFDWQIPTEADAGSYSFGASFRDQNDFETIYETTSPGQNTEFGDNWIIKDGFNVKGKLIQGSLSLVENGPDNSEVLVPENGSGFAYFNISTTNEKLESETKFYATLIKNSSEYYVVNALMMTENLMRIEIPNRIVDFDLANFILSDNLDIDKYSVHLNHTILFNARKIVSKFTRKYNIFASGSAGASLELGSIGAGPSLSMASLSVKGSAGAGLKIELDEEDNLFIDRRMEFEVSTSLKMPKVNAGVGEVEIGPNAEAKIVSKTLIGQKYSFSKLNLSEEEKKMAQTGFVLETLSLGGTAISPTVGLFFNSVVNTLNNLSGVENTFKDALIKNYWGMGLEGKISAGFSAKVKLSENSSISIGASALETSLALALQSKYNFMNLNSPFVEDISLIQEIKSAFNFDFSLLDFGLKYKNDRIKLDATSNKLSIFDAGLGMETKISSYFNKEKVLSAIKFNLVGGGKYSLVGNKRETYYNTEISIPIDYKNILESSNNGIAGTFAKSVTTPLGFGLVTDAVDAMKYVYNNYEGKPIVAETKATKGFSLDLGLGIDLSAALGIGGGLSLGFDFKYLDELEYTRKYSEIYGFGENYLLYVDEYDENMLRHDLKYIFNELFSGTVPLIKTAMRNLVVELNKITLAGQEFLVNSVNNSGKFLAGIYGISPGNGEFKLINFSPNSPRTLSKVFHEPIVKNMYYSTNVKHYNLNKLQKITNDVNTTLIVVSETSKISFIPEGQEESLDSLNNKFQIKMLIDTTKLAKLDTIGFKSVDKNRVKLYRYDDKTNYWILEGGTLDHDTVKTEVYHLANYALGIELTDAEDNIAPTIDDYGMKDRIERDSLIIPASVYAIVSDNEYGVGIDLSQTNMLIDGDTVNYSYNPTEGKMFYSLVNIENGNHDVEIIVSDYNGNSKKFSFTITGVEEDQKPNYFKLDQNYPNPFNPTTTISYTIPQQAKVKIILWNVLGQYIETLYEGYQYEGNYSLLLDASGLASGTYYYSLYATMDNGEKYQEVKKMILLK